MTINFETVTEDHVNEAVDLVLNAYYEEKKAIQYLPEDNYANVFKKRIKNLFGNGSGIVAIFDKRIVGFLAGYEIKELWGKCKGIYCPVYGHGAINKKRREIYQQLYQKAAEIWVGNGITNHSITLYAQDTETIDTWFWLGFGLRCVDAIREVSLISKINRSIEIKKVKENDIPFLANVQNELHMYFRKSPIFMPVQEENPIDYLKEWLSKDNHHLWMAYDNEQTKTLGLMKIEPSGERFITES